MTYFLACPNYILMFSLRPWLCCQVGKTSKHKFTTSLRFHDFFIPGGFPSLSSSSQVQRQLHATYETWTGSAGHRQGFPLALWVSGGDTWQGFPPRLVGVVRGCWRSNERYPTPPLSFLSLPGPVGNTYKTRTMSKQSQTSEEPSGKAIFCHAPWQNQGQDTGLHLNS